MKTIEVFQPVSMKHLARAKPERNHAKQIVDEDCLVYINGKLEAVYLILPESELSSMRKAAENVKTASTRRSQGLPQKSAVFGPVPRKPNMAQDFCRFTRATHEQAQFVPAIFGYNELVKSIYKQYFPEKLEEETRFVENNVHNDWRWLNGPFTNCNFNVNQAIPYHFDTANVPNGLSNVLILKKNIAGGELVCPELGFAFSQRDRAFVLFNGQSILHGVLPIKQIAKGKFSYRASIVFYTLSMLKHCLCKQSESARAKQSAHIKNTRSTSERNALILKQAKGLLSKQLKT